MLLKEANPAAKADQGSNQVKADPTSTEVAEDKKSKKAKHGQQQSSEEAAGNQKFLQNNHGAEASAGADEAGARAEASNEVVVPKEGAVLQSLYDQLWAKVHDSMTSRHATAAQELQGQADADTSQQGQTEKKKKKRKHPAGGDEDGGAHPTTPTAGSPCFRKLHFTITHSTTTVATEAVAGDSAARLHRSFQILVAQLQQAEAGSTACTAALLGSIQEVQAAVQLGLASCSSSQEAQALVQSLLQGSSVSWVPCRCLFHAMFSSSGNAAPVVSLPMY
jgi:hypothetical protein